jgi:hypothetical protein
VLNANNVQLVDEIKIPSFGDVDWVAYIIKHNSIQDLCGIELVAGSTTQTGEVVKAVRDFQAGRLSRSYKYGLNTYDTSKRSFTQILNKGQVFENWKKLYIWLIQDFVLQDILERFKINLTEGLKKDNFIVFQTVRMSYDDSYDIFRMEKGKLFSASVADLRKAYERQSFPPIEEFIESISRKVRKLYRLGTGSRLTSYM